MTFKISSYDDVPENTPLEDIPKKVARCVQGFRSNKTIPLDYRKEQLRNLYYAIADNKEAIHEAMYKDFDRPPFETDLSEVGFVLNEIIWFINKMDELAKPEGVELDLIMKMASAHIYKQPFGTVLIISPWNYPLLLSISPLAAAIAAGNTAVLKFSEMVPNTSRLLIKILESNLDPGVFAGIGGAIPQSTALLKEKFDKIMYTGNGQVGRIIARAAAETLTPVLLELGGKSPTIITKNADLRLAARRLMWGKQVNAGQTCVAPDYILVEESVKPKFIEELKKAYAAFFPDELNKDTPHTHIVSERHFSRLTDMFERTKGKVIVGGHSDPQSRFFAPTFLDGIDASDSTMESEIFGPLVGIITVKNVDEAIEFIIREHDTPLAIYIFSKDKAEQEMIMSRTRSGGVGINDPIMHVTLMHAPFSGFGQSGSGGGYHGKSGFMAFTHSRTVFSQASIVEPLLDVRYPPYTDSKHKQTLTMTFNKPWFSRTGPVKRSFFSRVIASKFTWLALIVALIAGKIASK